MVATCSGMSRLDALTTTMTVAMTAEIGKAEVAAGVATDAESDGAAAEAGARKKLVPFPTACETHLRTHGGTTENGAGIETGTETASGNVVGGLALEIEAAGVDQQAHRDASAQNRRCP